MSTLTTSIVFIAGLAVGALVTFLLIVKVLHNGMRDNREQQAEHTRETIRALKSRTDSEKHLTRAIGELTETLKATHR